MKKHTHFLLFFFALCLLLQAPSQAQQHTKFLKLAAPISDHMVLQHGKPTSIWGTAKPNTLVTVSFRFAEQSIETTSDENGNWSVELKPLEISSDPSSLSINSDGENVGISDILVGEVWMCSGQSNMAWTLRRTGERITEEANMPLVRMFRTGSQTAETVQSDCKGQWIIASPQSIDFFSAVGFHFGRELFKELQVPIGLIDTSWGGKPVEAFTSREKLKTVENAMALVDEWDAKAASYDAEKAKTKFDTAMAKWKAKRAELVANAKDGEKPKLPRRPKLQIFPKLNTRYPGAIYNQKVAPWTRYTIAGAIWYQGESNAGRAVQYESLLTALIEDWRAKWGSDFPFYIVQLANFKKPTNEPGVPSEWAELQHFQTQVAQTVPDCGLAVINDIGAANNIHPKNKRDVGHRLALLALKKHYRKDIEAFASPLYKSHRVADDHIVVTMEHVGSGLKSRDGEELKRFEIAGADQKWHWAKAEILSKDTIKISSDAVPQPMAARYAWAANPEGANLANSGDLPASLFRTDDWPLKTANRFTLSNNPAATVRKRMERQGFKSLFNGKDLTGWRNPYDFGKSKIVGDEIHLTANRKFFLVTEKEYSDFVLFVEINLPEGKANSGVMFRCHVKPNKVFGYQAECDGSDRCWSAGLYDEGRRGWVWPSKKGRSKEKKFLEYEKESQEFFAQPKIHDALKRTGWNRYKITCRGNKITIELNGVKVTDLEDDTDAKGFIGIQHHGEKGQTYRFRNIFIKELK